MHTTILFAFNRPLNRREISRVRAIAKRHDASLVYIGEDRRVTHHTGWFTYANIGAPFTTRAALDIAADLEAAGIVLN